MGANRRQLRAVAKDGSLTNVELKAVGPGSRAANLRIGRPYYPQLSQTQYSSLFILFHWRNGCAWRVVARDEEPVRGADQKSLASDLDHLSVSPSALLATIRPMPGPPAEFSPLHTHQGRCHERTHLFLSASLCSRAGSIPVHVRNISPCGALIEGAIVPEPGDDVILKRGSLQASATIVWKECRRAGIAFASAVFVEGWMARQPNAHQGRVDEVILAIRSRGRSHPLGTSERRDILPGRSVEDELWALKNSLSELEKGLLGDELLVASHPEIQLLDVAMQSIDRMLGAVRQ